MDNKRETLLVPHDIMRQTLYDILCRSQVPEEKAGTCADVITENSLEGVYSHGVNRFYRLVDYVKKGIVKPNNDPICRHRSGVMEQWHGNSGMGITNALTCSERAMQLAAANGIGCVALSHTNHWMRAGTYARHAAANGFAFIGWSNTTRNMPAWGSIDPRLGNNPLTIGVPHGDVPIILDMAMTQFSYGALDSYKMKEEKLPVPGGFDDRGNLTTDPSAILKSRRTLPIGYWKGAGLSLLLDMFAAILSGGLPVSEISKQPEETNLSQVFIAFDVKSLGSFGRMDDLIDDIIRDLKESTVSGQSTEIRYPGESSARTKERNLVNGIPVHAAVWNEILRLREA